MGKAGRDSSLTIEDVPNALAPPGQQGSSSRQGGLIDRIVSKGGIAIRLTDE